MPLLIWVKGSRGPEIQLIHREIKSPNGEPTYKAIPNNEFIITEDEARLGLDVLARLYPCKEG